MRSCAVNGKLEVVPDEKPVQVDLGTIQEWRVQNIDLHAFHLQGSPVQLIDVASPSPTNFWQVTLPEVIKRHGPGHVTLL
jgi:FtsP/CotA-like multicopper oxidase with cupredoxin domain